MPWAPTSTSPSGDEDDLLDRGKSGALGSWPGPPAT